MLWFSIFHGKSYWNRHWINGRLDCFRADDVAGLKSIRFDDFIDGIRLDWFSHVICAILTLSFSSSSFYSSVSAVSHLILRDFRSFFSSPFASATVLIEVFQHDVLMANKTGLCSSSAGFSMLGVFDLCPSIFAKLANNWFSGTNLFVSFEELRHDHLVAEWAFLLFVKFFLTYVVGTSCCYWSLMSIILSQFLHFLMLRQQ